MSPHGDKGKAPPVLVSAGVPGTLFRLDPVLPGLFRFETVEQLFLMHQPGYAPADARKTEPVLDLGAFDRAFRAFVLDEYHHIPEA